MAQMDQLQVAQSLTARLARAASAVKARVAKAGHNDNQNYDFATEADVVSVCRAALLAEGVVISPSFSVVSCVPFKTSTGKDSLLTTVVGTFTATADDQSMLFAQTVGQGADPSDKGIYKAMAGARKYAYLQGMGLVTGGDDPESESEASAASLLTIEIAKTRVHLVRATKGILALANIEEPDAVAATKAGPVEVWPLETLAKTVAGVVRRLEQRSEAETLVATSHTVEADEPFA
jgi:hypothetical protein